jgi:dihydroorotate dehydrogenase (NAD+) catalytic subunit
MLNSIGLQNVGVTALIRDLAPVYATWHVPVVASIMGFTVQEYAEVAAHLEGVDGLSGVELNLSCPNTERGGIEFGQEPDAAASVVRGVLRATTLPIIAKLTPNVADPRVVAEAVVDAGVNALCIGNTLVGMAMDMERASL